MAQGNLFSHALDEEQLAGYLSNLEQGQKERFIYDGLEKNSEL